MGTIILTIQQIEVLGNLLNQNRYADGYEYVAEVVNNSPTGDPRIVAFLERAASVNSDDGSPISEFVHAATYEAARDEGVIITPQQYRE